MPGSQSPHVWGRDRHARDRLKPVSSFHREPSDTREKTGRAQNHPHLRCLLGSPFHPVRLGAQRPALPVTERCRETRLIGFHSYLSGPSLRPPRTSDQDTKTGANHKTTERPSSPSRRLTRVESCHGAKRHAHPLSGPDPHRHRIFPRRYQVTHEPHLPRLRIRSTFRDHPYPIARSNARFGSHRDLGDTRDDRLKQAQGHRDNDSNRFHFLSPPQLPVRSGRMPSADGGHRAPSYTPFRAGPQARAPRCHHR